MIIEEAAPAINSLITTIIKINNLTVRITHVITIEITTINAETSTETNIKITTNEDPEDHTEMDMKRATDILEDRSYKHAQN